tara:strand:+ start:1390 stop:1587 length:198 start_codon:yes stop_codon:yes gene_type:complete
MVKSDTYQIVDATGWRMAQVRFNSAINEGLHHIYLQDVCDSMEAAGWYPIEKQPELSELGQLIAD